MSPPDANTQLQPSSFPAISTDCTLALLQELTASIGDTLDHHKLLARLASVESSLQPPNVTTTPLIDLPAVDILVPNALFPSALPPPTSPSSMCIPATSPTHTQPEPKVDELENAPCALTPVVSSALPSIPSESPLSGRVHFTDAQTGVHADSDIECCMFLPDWHLGYTS
ncbi:hypothetical protein EDD17DRAFT_1750832 [Pisolithus thermaeus]|nr:hypothetical protein EDD17DRAFT_1750827 [Pisolithus thermaeus]KAI6168242.1 hypothetical protein EDD17DRAFT_1750832 [Pisolithus thermaeus]